MSFDIDFRHISGRRGLFAALGVSEAVFESIVSFDPANRSSGHIASLDVPSFIRHEIPKKNSARGTRTVWEPTFAKNEYRSLARRFDAFFRLTLPRYPHPSSYGYRLGRNIKENAAEHSGHHALLTVDIQNFFQSINAKHISCLFEGLEVNSYISDLLSRFTTIGGNLPAGLATSPVLSNAIALPIDVACRTLADQFEATYTRYADDITFSGDNELPSAALVESILTQHGFMLAQSKTRRSKIGQAHYVTGLSVSDPSRPHVPYFRKHRLRQELYYAQKYGLASHISRSKSNNQRSSQSEINRIDGMVRFVSYHEPTLASLIQKEWRAILAKSGARSSFSPRGQNRLPFYIFVDEAEYIKDGVGVLALALVVTQNAERMISVSKDVLRDYLDDLWVDGNFEEIEKKGLHFSDAPEDLRLVYVKSLATMPASCYVALVETGAPADYEKTYIRLLGALISGRLMATESLCTYISFEENSKVSQGRVRQCVQQAYDDLVTRDDHRPRSISVEFVSKPHLGISAADFFLGVLGKYLRSLPPSTGRPESRDRLMFERLRDKYRLILQLEPWTEYTRRNPISAWVEGRS